MEGDVIVTQELFKFEHLDETADAEIIGEYRSMGLGPCTLEKAKQLGSIDLISRRACRASLLNLSGGTDAREALWIYPPTC